MLHSFFEEDKLQLPCTLKIILVDLTLEILNNFLQVLEVLIAGLACLEAQNLGEVTILHLLDLNSLGETLAYHRAVAEEPLPIGRVVEAVAEDSFDLMGPEGENLFGVVDVVRRALKNALKDTTNIS